MKRFTKKDIQEYLESKIDRNEYLIEISADKGRKIRLRQRIVALQEVYDEFFKK